MLAERLLATFLDELEEQLRVLNAELLVLERDPSNADTLRSIFRVVHTLKGAARAVNLPPIEHACHALETLLAAARAGALTLGQEEFGLLFRAADALTDAGRRMREGEGLDDSPIAVLAATLADEKVTTGADPDRLSPLPLRAPVVNEPIAQTATDLPVHAAPASDQPAERSESALRVRSDKLDALFAGVGALSVTSARIVDRGAQLDALDGAVSHSLLQWRRSVRRLRRRLPHGGDPLVLETIDAMEHTLGRLARQVSCLATDAARDGATLEHETQGVSESVRLLRMRPFGDACEALPRVARDVAAEAGKEVRLLVVGAEVEADRAVLDGIREPLVHLVRNAVDHGIELPAVRAQRGKPPQGTVTVSAALRGDRLIVTVADDGGGVDAGGLRASFARAGRAVGGGERELAAALLAGGVSSRTEASTISGRGVGLDVARAAVARLGGRLDVTWVEGQGATLFLETPLTLARLRAVTAEVGSQAVALPTAHVERLLRLPRADIRRVEGQDVFSAPNGDAHAVVPLATLARLLGPPLVDKPVADPASVIVLSVGGSRLGVIVDQLCEEQELIVRALPGRRAVSAHITGAAVLPNGRIALLLDVASLTAAAHGARHVGPSIAIEDAAAARRPTVLVVDDSLTTRTLERSVLEAAGYVVLTAVDGADGWRVIEDEGCDLVVADVEMPRMDGIALCEAIRASERHRSLPVVLVTALESPEHRARGLKAGADAYIGKSSFDRRNLLDTVAQLLDPPSEAE